MYVPPQCAEGPNPVSARSGMPVFDTVSVLCLERILSISWGEILVLKRARGIKFDEKDEVCLVPTRDLWLPCAKSTSSGG